MYKFESTNNCLLIGAIGDSKTVADLNGKGCNVSSGYNMQLKILDGLEKLGYYFDTITGHISPPNRLKNFIVNYNSQNRNTKVTDLSVSYINLPIFDRIMKRYKIGKAVKCWIRDKENAYILIYSLSSIFLLGGLDAKKKKRNCKMIIIVPDLPEYMSNKQDKLYRMLKKVDRYIIDYCLKKMDGFVLFSEQMREKLPMENKPFVVMEGIIQDVNREKYMEKIEKRANNFSKIIMLSGALDYEEGIATLLEAFSKINNSEYKLWLTGSGNAIDLISKYADADKRITYFGYIASYEAFSELQQKASVFVLMVPPTHPKAAYYFPSKIMEYLATGGIVACYKLPCIPDEYDQYLEYFEGQADQVSKKLIELCEVDMSIYKKKAEERYEFLGQKNSQEQMRKVEHLLKSLA